ncbi:MAG: DUF5694 domain-containing protein, partial [Gemmatimonadota bacterium]
AFAVTWAFVGTRPVGPTYCEPNDHRVEVLLLGSYHMANPEADAFNMEADDVLAPKRQTEIRAVVDRLAEFGPTRVAIEAPWGDSATIVRWREFAAGEREARRSEEEQIGFRLARQVGHDTVYAIDYRLGMDFPALQRAAEQDSGLAAQMARFQPIGEAAVALMADWLAEGSVGHMLYQMNRPDVLAQAHWPYVDLMLPMVTGDDYVGPEVVAGWYDRNLKIFANLLRITGAGDDRLFVIYGQGHVPILRQLVIDHPDYCVEDPLPYLEGL